MSWIDVLRARREAILAHAATALERAHLEHYEAAGEDVRRQRLESLFDLVLRAVEERNLTELLAESRRIADERFAAGFDLSEVLSAFNVLEEAAWTALVAEVPAEELPEALGLVATALGAGKDRLAAAYVAHASSAHTPTLDLRALFAGFTGG